ncbi:MAG: hypothetical protein ABI651_08760 [Verrucomicrobiota bacterium]
MKTCPAIGGRSPRLKWAVILSMLCGALAVCVAGPPGRSSLTPLREVMIGLSYVGLFDDLAIFNRALTDKEIQILFHLESGAGVLVH